LSIFKQLKSSRGIGILEVLIAGILVSLITLGLNQLLIATRRSAALAQRRILADTYTTELLEFFRSLTSTQLSDYLKKNPVTGSTATPYPLCAHINILDRAGSSGTNRLIVNADPLADLGTTLLDNPVPRLSVNRYYQVQVVNIHSLVVNAAACGAPPTYTLAPDERFLVTVGVTWVPMQKDTDDIQRMVATIVLPE